MNRALVACAILAAASTAGAAPPVERVVDTVTVEPVEQTPLERVVPRWTVPGRPTIALALSGGGARGIAHVGVLEEMMEDGVEFDAIAGTSFGAVVGSFFAAGYWPDEVQAILETGDWNDIIYGLDRRNRILSHDEDRIQSAPLFRARFRGSDDLQVGALVDSRPLERKLYRYLLRAQIESGGDFDRLRIPFRPVATDVLSGDPVVPDRGDLVTVVLGSAAYPGVFRPVPFEDALLVDGGLVENIPTGAARSFGKTVVLAVDVSEGIDARPNIGNALSLLNRSVTVLMETKRKTSQAEADLVFSPDVIDFSSADFNNVDAIVASGREAYRAVRDRVRALLEARAADTRSVAFDRIEVAGTSKLDAAEVGERLEATSGQVPRYRVAVELARLLNHGPFDQGRVDIVETPSGVVLRFVLSDAPVVRGVVVRGLPVDEAETGVFKLIGQPLSSGTLRVVSLHARERVVEEGSVLVTLDELTWDAESARLHVEVGDAPVGRVTLDVEGDVRLGRVRRFLHDLQGKEFRFDTLADRLDELVVRGTIRHWSLSPHVRDDGTVDLVVHVKGDEFYELAGSLEYRGELGLAGYVRVAKSNISSRGDFAELVMAGATETGFVQLRYRTEYGVGFRNYGGEAGVRYFDNAYPFVDEDQDLVRSLEEEYRGWRGWLTFIRRLRWGAVIQAGASYQLEDLEATPDLAEEERSRVSLTLAVDLDRRDRLMFPSRGGSFGLRGEHGISGDDLWKYEVDTDGNFAAGRDERQTYTIRAGAGLSDGADRRPYFFNPGGFRELYGFIPYGAAAPQYARAGATWRYRLYDLRAARVFVEVGGDAFRTALDRSDLTDESTRYGYGASLIAHTDFVGPITLGFARNDDHTETVFLTLGYALFD